MKENYYSESLNAARLFDVYQTRIDRVKQYLEAEIEFVKRDLAGKERVLELGAGYGRIMKELAPFAASVVGVDFAEDSVRFGAEYLASFGNCRLHASDAHRIDFDAEFDVVLCLQNGLSAMKGDPWNLVERSLKALVPGGKAYFSTYSSKFWDYRLEWFKEQSDKGLLGEIDWDNTKDGWIICRDGFKATTFSEKDLDTFGKMTGLPYRLEEVDESSLFLIVEKQ
jgi:2-polyprenyl-6-hydroxyphenyl methylase/3-demethylubiquinone-9 3-methyltransferase